ncbi:MAG: hypothetical protein HN919_12830 [Verrucomicrobia bacterium]|nr:hypothetical protein [Verrucomicrobiota bacterium]MBT7699737.1 hypothetical protein [Verrucomicrobiota bacterium]
MKDMKEGRAGTGRLDSPQAGALHCLHDLHGDAQILNGVLIDTGKGIGKWF